VGILEDLLAVQAADPAFNPARPVEPAFARLPPDVQAGTLIEDPTTAQVADLANGLYDTDVSGVGWIAVMQRLVDESPQVVVPGHGDIGGPQLWRMSATTWRSCATKPGGVRTRE
jgi:hypothetical protein